MKSATAVIVLSISLIVAFTILSTAETNTSKPVLAGTRPVIDACRYQSIQAAIDAVPEKGGMVLLPPGEFEISEPLVVSTADTTIRGSGAATHIKNVNTAGKAALLLRHPDGSDSRSQNLWRIRLADFRITGNEKSGHGIEARRINELFIDGVTVSYHGGDGIHLYFCYEDPRICNSLITYNKKTGLNIQGCHDIVVSANQFEENDDALVCSDGFNLCMNGNNLDDHLGHGVVIENTYGSVVSGNMIEECAGSAVVLDRDCYGITVSANVIAHNRSGGVDLRDAHGCAVSANTFTIMSKHSIYVGPNSGRITITGNNFSNSYIGDGRIKRAPNDAAAAGLVFESTSDIAVVGNLFSSLRPWALTLSGESSDRVLFSNNILTDTAVQTDALSSSVVENNLTERPKTGR